RLLQTAYFVRGSSDPCPWSACRRPAFYVFNPAVHSLDEASAGSFPSTHAPSSFWYFGGTSTLPLSPPFQPRIWFGLPRALLLASRFLAHEASASTSLPWSLSQNSTLPWR